METETLSRSIHADYQTLLQDSRWLEFGNGVKHRKGNLCEVCESEVRVEIHHLGYKDGRLPWEYEDDEVAVLCRHCHFNIHKVADEIWNEVLKTKNQWVIYECLKAVRATLAKHPNWTAGKEKEEKFDPLKVLP